MANESTPKGNAKDYRVNERGLPPPKEVKVLQGRLIPRSESDFNEEDE